jgi:hypothetical protein
MLSPKTGERMGPNGRPQGGSYSRSFDSDATVGASSLRMTRKWSESSPWRYSIDSADGGTLLAYGATIIVPFQQRTGLPHLRNR